MNNAPIVDLSLLVNYTPTQIQELMCDFAERYCRNRQRGNQAPVQELAASYYNFHTSMLYLDEAPNPAVNN